MQHANTALKLSVIAALLAHGAFAVAQPVALPPAPSAPAALAAPALPEIKAAGAVSLAASAKAVAIGKQDDASGAAGSLKEMENLQREVFLGELRAKIRSQSGAGKIDAPTVAAGAMTSPSSAPAPLTPATFAAPATSPTMFPIYRQSSAVPMELQREPKVELVSVIVTSARARADVMDDGVVKTVKEGDKFGDWSITSITTNGVTVERTVTRLTEPQPPMLGAKVGGAAMRKRVIAFVPVPYEKTMSVMLKPYRPPVVDTTQGAVIGGVAVPVIPPLPASIKPQDSTSILPALPTSSPQIAAK